MAVTPPLPDGFHTRPLDDGNVAFVFVQNGQEIIEGRLTPEQVGIVAANLLSCSHNAFNNADRTLGPQPNIRTKPVAATRWVVAKPGGQDQLAVVIESGEAAIAYAIPPADARSVARTLIAGSYSVGSMSVRAHLREALRDSGTMLREIGKLASSRLKAFIRHRRETLALAISGRALRVFRRLEINPGAKVPEYAPVRACIYCSSTIYSKKPGIRTHPLGAEHVIPEGIGGTLELPEASCQEHEDTTGRLVEGDVLGRTLKALRVHLKLKKKGSGPHPRTLPLDAKVDGKKRKIDIPTEDYPVAFMMLHFDAPSFVPSNTEPGRRVQGAVVAVLKHDAKALYRKHRVTEFSTASWDSQMLSRMLAKIGHSFAVAELGMSAFKPLLLEFIRDGNLLAMNLVGGEPPHAPVRKSNALHELELSYQRDSGKSYVVARIRLFARHQGPRYYVVVGESLESPIARARRVFSSRISRMLAR